MKGTLNPQLLEQVSAFRERKVPRAQVQSVLGNAGWTDDDVEAALKRVRYPAYARAAAADRPAALSAQQQAEAAAAALLASERERSGRKNERSEVLHDAAAGALLPSPVGEVFMARALSRVGFSPVVAAVMILSPLLIGMILPAAGFLAGILSTLFGLYLFYRRYVYDL